MADYLQYTKMSAILILHRTVTSLQSASARSLSDCIVFVYLLSPHRHRDLLDFATSLHPHTTWNTAQPKPHISRMLIGIPLLTTARIPCTLYAPASNRRGEHLGSLEHWRDLAPVHFTRLGLPGQSLGGCERGMAGEAAFES